MRPVRITLVVILVHVTQVILMIQMAMEWAATLRDEFVGQLAHEVIFKQLYL